MHMNQFTPGDTVSLATSTSSSRVALGKPVPGPGGVPRVVRVALPAGADLVYIAFGDSTVVATAADSTPSNDSMPIIPGAAPEYFSIGPGVTHIAAIAAANTPTIIFTTGYGN